MEPNGPSKRKGSPRPETPSKRAAVGASSKADTETSEAPASKQRAGERPEDGTEKDRSAPTEESSSVSELRAAFGGFHPLALPLSLETLSQFAAERKASSAVEEDKDKPASSANDQAQDEEGQVQRSSSSASAIHNNFLTQVVNIAAGDNTFARLLSTFGTGPPGPTSLAGLDPFLGVITPTASSAAPLPGGLADPFAMSPIDAFRRRPSQDAETFRRLASQEALDAFRRPASQDTLDTFRRPSNDAADAFRRHPSLDTLDAFRRRPSQDLDAFMRPPSQDVLEPFRRRESQDATLPSYFTGGPAGTGVGDKYVGWMPPSGVPGMSSSLFSRTLSLHPSNPQDWQQQQLATAQWPLARAATGGTGEASAGVTAQWPLARAATGGIDGVSAQWQLPRLPTGGTDASASTQWPLTRTATGGADSVVNAQWPLARAPTGGTDALSQWPIARTATGGIDAAIGAQWPLARAPTGGTDGLAAWPIARAATGGIDAALNGQFPLGRVGAGGMDTGLGTATRRPEDLANLASVQQSQQNQFQLQLQFQLQQQLLQVCESCVFQHVCTALP
jgi:hypothetical protein